MTRLTFQVAAVLVAVSAIAHAGETDATGHPLIGDTQVSTARDAIKQCGADATKCPTPQTGSWMIKDVCGFGIPITVDDDVIRGQMWHNGDAWAPVNDAANGVRSLCMGDNAEAYKKSVQQKITSIHLTWNHKCDLAPGKGADSQTPACQHATFTLASGVLTVELHEVNPTFGTWGPGNLNEWLKKRL